MPEGLPSLIDVRPFVHHVVLVFGQIIHERVIRPEMIQNQVAQLLYTAELVTADVVNLARDKIIDDVCQRGNEIVDIHEYSVISQIDVVRNAVEGSIGEKTNDASIIVVVLAGSVCIEESQPDDGITEPLLEIHDLNFVHPLRDGVIVELDNGVIQRNVFGKDMLVLVAVNFR